MRLIGQNLCGERGGEMLFCGLDFIIHPQELLLVVGPNGVGKSTFLRIIAGLYRPSDGMVFFDHDNTLLPVAPFVHYLGEKNAMKPQLSVLENLKFWIAFYGRHTMSAEEALKTVELPDIAHLPFGVLSTGQRRRVAIARLLLSHRPLWIVDEPTSGLDRNAADLFSAIMRRHLEDGGMVIAATHLPLGLEADITIAMNENEAIL